MKVFTRKDGREAGWKEPMPGGDSDRNPPDIGFFALLREDLRTHDDDLTAPGFWAVAVHRFGNWRMGLPRMVRGPFSRLYKISHQGVVAGWGIDMPYNVPIGRRLRICHHGGVHLGAWSVGDDVTIRHSVTIGVPGVVDDEERSPIIGNGVELGPGAVVIGTVEVGDGAYVGPNAVVVNDVPAGSIATGIPARCSHPDDAKRERQR